MPSNHGKQKKALKHKKKRESAQRKARDASRLALHPTSSEIVRAVAGRPFGPAFVSEDWEDTDRPIPALVSVVLSRRALGNLVVGALVLVDRTCLGVKNFMLFPPESELELAQRVARIGEGIGALRPVEPLLAQSIVYNAIAYARDLGFPPHPDFADALFGPAPSTLIDTPLARPARPIYVMGPDDDVRRILTHLARVVGPAGFDFFADEGLSRLELVHEDDALDGEDAALDGEDEDALDGDDPNDDEEPG